MSGALVRERTDDSLRRRPAYPWSNCRSRPKHEVTMNTPRQPNVRTPIEQIPRRIRNSEELTPVPTPFIGAFEPASKPAVPNATPSATTKDGIPESAAAIRTTGTLRLPLAGGGRLPMPALRDPGGHDRCGSMSEASAGDRIRPATAALRRERARAGHLGEDGSASLR
jgi:hypothetical protein